MATSKEGASLALFTQLFKASLLWVAAVIIAVIASQLSYILAGIIVAVGGIASIVFMIRALVDYARSSRAKGPNQQP